MIYDTIIFDCDGTLSDTEYLNNKATADVLTELGFSYTVEDCLESFAGMAMSDVKALVEKWAGRNVPASFVPEFIQRAEEYQGIYLKAVPGAVDATRVLSQKYKTCVASNGERNLVINSLKTIGLFDLFEEEKTFTKIQVARGKPAPDLFLFAAKQLGSDPRNCIVIEDSPSGVMAGIAAGMVVIGYTGAHHNEQGAIALKEAGAHIICASWGDILHSINSLTTALRAV